VPILTLLALVAPAHASCIVSETRGDGGVEYDVHVDGTCAAVSIVADRPATLSVSATDADGFRVRIPKEQVVEHPWSLPAVGWRVTAPLLAPGDHLYLRLAWSESAPGDAHVDVLLDGSAPAPARGGVANMAWRYEPAGRHPEWGFTDPRFGKMVRETEWTFGPDGEAGWLDGFPEAGSAWWPGGPGTVKTRSEEAPARAIGQVDLPPGALSFTIPGGRARTSGLEATAAGDVVSVPSPAGGTLRWSVESLGGIDIVGDDVRFVQGTDNRFRAASLPEPSVPLRLRGNRDVDLTLQTLWTSVREPRRGSLGDATHPRPLNRAWRSGWLTDGERTLVLLRFLGQERIAARWVLTGTSADLATLTGFDRLLVVGSLPGSNQVLWLDPACASCGFGEIDPSLSGRPAVGGADHVPVLPGALGLTSTLVPGAEPDTFVVETRVSASGAGARFVRLSVGPAADRGTALAHLFGVPAPFDVALEGWDADINVVFTSARPPRPVSLPEFAAAQ